MHAAAGQAGAWAQHRDAGATPWALLVIEPRGRLVASVTSYLDVDTLFPRFGLPERLAG